jgi:adenosylcobinamide kinase/adenosylcobinamide-phosphate guanylyltransferase
MTVTLVLGGARSGKSRHAEGLCTGERHYVATAQAFDDEMRARIAKHRQDRGSDWVTHEAPHSLVETLRDIDAPGRCILVDCLTLWLSNTMLAESDWQGLAGVLAALLPAMRADVVLVSNEVGMGIVPETSLGRAFRDAQGILNQRVAEVADTVVFVAAGLPLVLKGER